MEGKGWRRKEMSRYARHAAAVTPLRVQKVKVWQQKVTETNFNELDISFLFHYYIGLHFSLTIIHHYADIIVAAAFFLSSLLLFSLFIDTYIPLFSPFH